MKDYNNQPPGGHGKLRALLAKLGEDQEQLNNDPRYKEGYDDGYRDAQENYRRLTRALAQVYKIDEWSGDQ
jgi:hypothetical protein